jgi:hypothetical protein
LRRLFVLQHIVYDIFGLHSNSPGRTRVHSTPTKMGFSPSVLYTTPEVNPINRKARSVPILNPINVYGRVFFFSWFGFMIAFWSWYVQRTIDAAITAISIC